MKDVWSGFLAGATTGLLSDIVMNPMETVRVTKLNPEHSKGRSSCKIRRDICRSHGLSGFFKGCGPVLSLNPVASALFHSSRGYLNDKLSHAVSWKAREWKHSHNPVLHNIGSELDRNTSLYAQSASTFMSQVLASLLWTPMNVVRSRQQVAAAKGLPVPSSFELVNQLGPSGLLKGFGTSILMNGPSNTIYWALYDKSYTSIAKILGKKGAKRSQMPSGAILGASLLSAFGTSLATYPLGTIMTVQQTSDESRGMVSTASSLYSQKGISGFYEGFLTNFVSGIPRSIFSAFAYEKFKEFYSNVLDEKTLRHLPKKLQKHGRRVRKSAKKFKKKC
ncbi:hypothetical protein P9112_010797 [Eukaryota sp. TZLM1-RC]